MSIDGCELQIYPKRKLEIFNRRHFSYIERINSDVDFDFRNDIIYSDEEYKAKLKQYEEDDTRIKDNLIAINYENAVNDKNKKSQYKNLYNKLLRFRESVGKIKFIKEQRLLRQEIIQDEFYIGREKKLKTIEVINEIPNKMKDEIRKVILNYSAIASQLDSTYPNRLFKATKTITQEDFWDTFSEIVTKQEKIQQYNLIKDLKIKAPKNFKKEYATALKIYLEDTNEKLSVFDDLIEKLTIFVETLNSKLNYKEVVISSEYGLQVKKGEEILALNALSSGEQQMITLYFELIFGIKDNVILIIDEPEISLHVAWQRELMSDFNKIISLKDGNLNIIIATHSPQVINNNWDSIIDLGEQNAK